MPLDQAIAIVRAESGKSFDPRVVEILERRYLELDQLARSSHRIAKLPTDVKVERGDAPAAGFERTAVDLASIHGAIAGERALDELAGAVAASTDREALWATLENSLHSVVPYQAMAIYIRRGDALLVEHSKGEFAAAAMPLGAGLSGWVAENGKAIINGNPSVEPGFLNDPGKFSALQSALSVPLMTTQGIIGVLSLYREDRDAFSNDHLASLSVLSSTLAKALELTDKSRQAA
jgi:putative methionine-R-sulfoxide reductase with GAF domain